jgi:secondary thiamine-phosphate synthase enzyme
MPTFRTEIKIFTAQRTEIIDITQRVVEACVRSGIRNGIVLVFPHHTSSAVYISDCDRSLTDDFQKILAELVPDGRDYAHDHTDCKKNAVGHIKANLAGHHISFPLTEGRLDFGPYQTIYYAEFDGQREKEIIVKIVGE